LRTEWREARDGLKLRIVRWGEGEREVLVVPGLAEHAGRYTHVAEALGARGWSLRVLELRGHGHSHGPRGHVDAWSEYVEDLRVALADMGPSPRVIGHSMGGLVLLEAVRSGAITAGRLALSNPLLQMAFAPAAWKTTLSGVMSRILPRLPIPTEIKPEWLSRDETVGRAYQADPLVYDAVTPRWFTEMLAAAARVRETHCPVPFAMFVSDSDPMNSFTANRAFAERCGAPITVYPGMRHEIFNEIGKEQVFADVGNWLEQP
jgi:lysophospholipase